MRLASLVRISAVLMIGAFGLGNEGFLPFAKVWKNATVAAVLAAAPANSSRIVPENRGIGECNGTSAVFERNVFKKTICAVPPIKNLPNTREVSSGIRA